MADYTSTQDGDWNNVNTWGGGGYPNLAGDTASVGHTVTYNVSETNELGDITITNGGILTFKTDANTKLTQGHNTITINSGGELRIGASGAVIDDAQTAEVYWNTTSDAGKGISIADGGKLTIYGDPVVYGSDATTTLAANWTAGQTFTVVGDYTTKWKAGQELTVHKNPAVYSHYNTDVALVTIDSLAANNGNTDVTIVEAFPTGTFNSGGAVTNVTRNVKMGKLNPTTTIGNYNTNRPRITDNNTSAGNVVISNAQLTGLDRALSGGTGSEITDSVIRNCSNGIYSGTGHSFSGSIYSCSSGLSSGLGYTVSGRIYGCSSGSNTGKGNNISGDVYSCNKAITYDMASSVSGNVYSCYLAFASYNSGVCISGDIYSCAYAFDLGTYSMDRGRLGWDGVLSRPNTYDLQFPSIVYCKNVKMPQAGLVFSNRNVADTPLGVLCSDYDQTHGAYRAYLSFATLTKITSPAGYTNSDESIQVEPLSNCNAENPTYFYGGEDYLKELGMPIYLDASEHTITVYMQCSGWASIPLNTEVYIELTYWNGSTYTSAVSTDVFAANDTWKAFTVTATPGEAGVAYLRALLKDYEAGASIIADAVPSVDGKKMDNVIDWLCQGNWATYNPEAGGGRRMRAKEYGI